MKTNYVLIDYENVHVKSLALLHDQHFMVKVFLGPKNTRLPVELVLAMHTLRERGEYILLEAHGNNALDFHIAYYLGILASHDPAGYFHVISRDTGFDPLLKHLTTRKIACWRSGCIEDMPCFKQANGSAVANDLPAEANSKAAGSELDNAVHAAVEDLIKRKASKPRTVKTLRSTICAKLGKGVPTALVDKVYEALLQQGYVTTVGTKVTYTLPPM